jgi:hypothetical protein
VTKKNLGNDDHAPDKSHGGINGDPGADSSPNRVKCPCEVDHENENAINDFDVLLEEELCPYCRYFLDFDGVEDKWAYWKAHKAQCRKKRKATEEGENAAS